MIKNQPAYYHQARVEVGILQLLNGRCDPGDVHHIVRLHDAFLHRNHLCLAFEQLGINLFELLKRNCFRGLSLGLLRLFLQQVCTSNDRGSSLPKQPCVARSGGCVPPLPTHTPSACDTQYDARCATPCAVFADSGCARRAA